MFNPKTKAIVFNNPNNPLGKVYTREEIQMVADLCKKHNVVVISDDVYEHMVSKKIFLILVVSSCKKKNIRLLNIFLHIPCFPSAGLSGE